VVIGTGAPVLLVPDWVADVEAEVAVVDGKTVVIEEPPTVETIDSLTFVGRAALRAWLEHPAATRTTTSPTAMSAFRLALTRPASPRTAPPL
jgi:hypothetical protein